MSALESVSLADLVPGLGMSDASAVDESLNCADDCTASICGHSLWPPSFLLSWEFRPPMIDEGKPGGVVFCWVILETKLPESSSWDMSDWTILFPCCSNSFLPIIRFSLVAIEIGIGCLSLIFESFPSLLGEQSEVLISKAMRVVAFDLLAILQRNGSRLKSLGFAMIPSSVILMFAILMLLGSCLLNPPCVFVVIIAIGMLADNVLLDVGHGL